MSQIESKSKLLGVLPMVKFYMDQMKLFPLLDQYLPKPKTMDLAPAQVLSMMIMNIITSVLLKKLEKLKEQQKQKTG